MKHCAICRRIVDTEEPAVLTMSGFGNPRHICEECEALLDDATLSKEPEVISDAIEKIGEKMKAANNDDKLILETVTSILENATERGEMIRNGVYDFENDEADGNEGDGEVPEELLETEEDRELDRREKAINEKSEKIMNRITLGIFIGALGFIAYWLISKFF